MDFIAALPLWVLFIFVFLLRVGDVTLGTMRTVTIVKGYIGLSMVLGFFEVGIWVVVISQVISRIGESWALIIAYAGGFAVGNGVGILIERKIALGKAVIRIISTGDEGRAIADALHAEGRAATVFFGEGAHGPVSLVYAACPRREIPKVVKTARMLDPDLFYIIEPAHETSEGTAIRLRPAPQPTGWRAIAKKK
jgi:uncharacterized protein YebE (UPF0316 family)